MNFFLRPPHREPVKVVQLPDHPHNIYQGSEFLDDAIRTHDQPPIYTEESVAAKSPVMKMHAITALS